MMLIDAYLAGELSGAALAAFEERVRTDAALRAELDAQRGLDDAILRAFAPPAQLAGTAAKSGPVLATIGRSTRRLWMGLAASVAIVGVLAAVYFLKPPSDPRGPRSPGQVYAAVLKGGFVPPVVCPNDPELFAQLVQNRLGVKLVPTLAADSGITLTGWGYSNHWGTPLGPGTLVLLAERGPDKIIVIMDRLRNDKPLADPKKGVSMFRKVAGDLVLYEITPLDHPILLPTLESR